MKKTIDNRRKDSRGKACVGLYTTNMRTQLPKVEILLTCRYAGAFQLDEVCQQSVSR